MNLNYHELFRVESSGTYGAFGLQILVAVHPPHDGTAIEIDFKHDLIRSAAYDAQAKIEDAVMRVVIAGMPEAQERAKAEREALLSCFQAPIYVENIPNGYCNRWCCAHLPWFVVTTRIGKIMIGNRKRVINIDWKEAKDTKTAEELFPDENVTKGERNIHAWSLEKAKAYVDAIMSGIPLSTNQNATVST